MSYFPSNNFPIKRTSLNSFYKTENFAINYITPFGSIIKRGKMLFNNGHSISVQAGSGLYCTPRQDTGVYTNVEMGFPSFKCKELEPYAEDDTDLLRTVYPYTPIEVVIYLIFENDGLKGYEISTNTKPIN